MKHMRERERVANSLRADETGNVAEIQTAKQKNKNRRSDDDRCVSGRVA